MTNSERLQDIKDRFAKLGWLHREDILWLLEVLGESKERAMPAAVNHAPNTQSQEQLFLKNAESLIIALVINVNLRS